MVKRLRVNDIGSNDMVKNAKRGKTTIGKNGKKYLMYYFRVR